MEVRRAAPVKLVVPDQYYDDLHETAEQFLYCANEASDYCWDNTDYEDCITSNVTARDALYDRLREETDLTANLVQEAIRRAVHAVDSGVDRWKKGKRTNKPEFTSWSMVYDKRSATFYRNKISLSTVNGRIECDFELPANSPTPYEKYVLSFGRIITRTETTTPPTEDRYHSSDRSSHRRPTGADTRYRYGYSAT